MDNLSTEDNSANLDRFTLFKNINPNEVIDYIKLHSPISLYNLHKELGLNKNLIYYLIRHFEFLGVVYTKLKINDSNRKIRLVYYNKKISEVQKWQKKPLDKLWKENLVWPT